MLPWAALLGTLGLNYRQHKRGRPTLCSTGRRFIPGPLMAFCWGVLTGWIVPHYVGGFKLDISLSDLGDRP